MGDNGKDQRVTDGNKSVYGIIDYLSFCNGHAVAELLIKVVFRTAIKIINSLALWQLHRYYG